MKLLWENSYYPYPTIKVLHQPIYYLCPLFILSFASSPDLRPDPEYLEGIRIHNTSVIPSHINGMDLNQAKQLPLSAWRGLRLEIRTARYGTLHEQRL
jgi:hypothetical protein